MTKKQNGVYRIEKGIPIPETMYGKRPSLMSILRSMEVGDSLLRNSYLTGYLQLLQPKRFEQHKVEGGIRVWRVA